MTPDQLEEDVLGRDIALGADRTRTASGGYATIAGRSAVRAAVLRRLTWGSLYHRPGWGAGLKSFLNQSLTPARKKELRTTVEQQLKLERRITKINRIDLSLDSSGVLHIELDYECAGFGDLFRFQIKP